MVYWHRPKGWVSRLAFFTLPYILNPWVYSNGFEGPGLGARATSMGGAFIGLANDWTAIYWNPAGLAQLSGAAVGVSPDYLRLRSHDSLGLSNPQVPAGPASVRRGDVFAQLGGEPTSFKGSDSSFGILLPAVGGYWRLKQLTLAGGSYAPLGFSFRVRDRQNFGYDASFKSQGFIANHNLSMGVSLLRTLRMGAGVNLVQASVERMAEKTTPSAKSFSTSKVTGLGLQGIFGVQWDILKNVTTGAVYRLGQDLSLNGHAAVSGLGMIPGESSDVQQKLRNPTTYGVGFAVKYPQDFVFTADWQRTLWRPSRIDVRFDQPGIILQNQNIDAGWSNRSRWRFGVEWQTLQWLALRAGTFHDPQAVPFDSQALTQLLDVGARYYTAGLTLGSAKVKCHLGVQYQSGREKIAERQIKKQALDLSLGVDYRFKG